MSPRSAAQKRAQKAYIEKFARAEIRMTPERRDTIRAHATALNESLNGFIGRAIMETMERDSGGTSSTSPQEAAGDRGLTL